MECKECHLADDVKEIKDALLGEVKNGSNPGILTRLKICESTVGRLLAWMSVISASILGMILVAMFK